MPWSCIASMQLTISAEHPSLPGHFPGHPVVPGVVILSHVFAALGEHIGQQRITGIKRLKFLQLVSPGQNLRVEIGVPQPGQLPFKCWLGDTLAVEGQVALSE